MSKEIDTLLERLEAVKGKHPSWHAKCPAHEDKSPSLHITEKEDGRILVHCFAGCGAADIMEAIGLTLRALYPHGKLGHYMPGKTRRHRKPEAEYGVQGARRMSETIADLKRQIKKLTNNV